MHREKGPEEESLVELRGTTTPLKVSGMGVKVLRKVRNMKKKRKKTPKQPLKKGRGTNCKVTPPNCDGQHRV